MNDLHLELAATEHAPVAEPEYCATVGRGRHVEPPQCWSDQTDVMSVFMPAPDTADFKLSVATCMGVDPAPTFVVVRVQGRLARWFLEASNLVRSCGAESMDYLMDETTWLCLYDGAQEVVPRPRASLYTRIRADGVSWRAVRDGIEIGTQLLERRHLVPLSRAYLAARAAPHVSPTDAIEANAVKHYNRVRALRASPLQ